MARLGHRASGNSPPMSLDPVPGPHSFLCPEVGSSLWAPLALVIGQEVLEGLKAQAYCRQLVDNLSPGRASSSGRSWFLGNRDTRHLPLLSIGIGLSSHSLSRSYCQLLCPQALQGGTRLWIPGCTQTAHTQLLLTGQWARIWSEGCL